MTSTSSLRTKYRVEDETPVQSLPITDGKVKISVPCSVEVPLQISEDRLINCLNQYKSNIEKSQIWLGYFGMFITIIATLLTTTFKDFIIPAAYWFAIFFLAGIYSLYHAFFSFLRYRHKGEIDDIIRCVKN